MAELDTSFYPKLNPPVNALDNASKFAGVQNSLNTNKQFEQMFAARQALGPIYQASIDPTTGQLDTNKLLSLASKNPATAWMAADIVQQAQTRQAQQIEIGTKQFDLQKRHVEMMANTLGPIAANPNATMADLTSAAGSLVAQGMLSPTEAAAEFMRWPKGQDGQMTPEQVRQTANQYLLRGNEGLQKIQAIYGLPQMVNTGGQTNIVQAGGLSAPKVTATLTNTMSPDTASSPTPVMVRNPDGTMSPSNMTRQQFASAAQTGPIATAPPLTAEGLTPEQSKAKVTWFDPVKKQEVSGTMSQFLEATGQSAPKTNAEPAKGSAPVAAGPKLGSQAAEDKTGAAAADQGISLQRSADAVPDRKAALGNMQTQLQKIVTGPGADATNELKAFAGRFGIPWDKTGVAAQEEFNKLGTQIALQQIQQLGGVGTDDKLGASIKANPSTALSKLGNDQIINLLKGNEDAIAVKNREWQSWLGQGHGPESYGQFSTAFNKSYDPRVFQSVYMNPEQRQEMLKAMTKDERKSFASSLRNGIQNGWIPDVVAQP